MRFIIILSYMLITGCVSNYLNLDVELEARRIMIQAASQENASHFTKAIQKYNMIHDNYSGTSYHKPAVLKLALLNLHNDNPDINYKASLKWLQIFSNLKLSSQEQETSKIYIQLLQQINSDQSEKEKLVLQIKKLKNDFALLTKKLSQSSTNASKKSSCESQLSLLNKDLENLKDKLQKLKEIDVQMHKTRKKNSDIPIESE